MEPRKAHWQAMLIAGVVSIAFVGAGYALYVRASNLPFHWDYLGRAALIGLGASLLLSLRWRGLTQPGDDRNTGPEDGGGPE